MAEEDKQTVPMYVVSNYKEFSRKIYGIRGFSIGRAVYLKTALYFVSAIVLMMILRNIPVVQHLFNWIPFLVAYMVIPGVTAYLLTDLPTEMRKPHQFFESFCKYQFRRLKSIAYYGGRAVRRPGRYKMAKPTLAYRVGSEEQEKDTRRKVKVRGHITIYQQENLVEGDSE